MDGEHWDLRDDVFESNEPIFIGGGTREGKGVIGAQLHAECRQLRIFFNIEHQEDIPGVRCESVEDLRGALAGGATQIDYRPGLDEEASFAELQQYLFDLGEQLGGDPSSSEYGPRGEGITMTLLVDEAQEIANGDKKKGPLIRCIKRGAKRGIKTVPLSQAPQEVANAALRQMEFHVWMGKPSSFSSGYFDNYGLPYDYCAEAPKYTGTVIHKTGTPLDRRIQAKEQYV